MIKKWIHVFFKGIRPTLKADICNTNSDRRICLVELLKDYMIQEKEAKEASPALKIALIYQ